MITGELKNRIDSIWEIFWTGGLTNPLDVIEQMTYELVSRVVKTRLLPLAIIFLCCVLPGLVRALSGEYTGGWGVFFTIFFGIMLALYMFLIVYCGTKLRRIREKYEK